MGFKENRGSATAELVKVMAGIKPRDHFFVGRSEITLIIFSTSESAKEG
jgi:hypothetical protein